MRVRFVVLDSETTGLDPRADRIITIGAVAVEAGDLVLGDSFHSLIRVPENTPAVTVHGVTRDQSRQGVEEAVALEAFLDYLRDGVIVGHHIGHDVATFNAGYERHWGIQHAQPESRHHGPGAAARAGRSIRRTAADPSLHAGCPVRAIRRHPARSAHRDR